MKKVKLSDGRVFNYSEVVIIAGNRLEYPDYITSPHHPTSINERHDGTLVPFTVVDDAGQRAIENAKMEPQFLKVVNEVERVGREVETLAEALRAIGVNGGTPEDAVTLANDAAAKMRGFGDQILGSAGVHPGGRWEPLNGGGGEPHEIPTIRISGARPA